MAGGDPPRTAWDLLAAIAFGKSTATEIDDGFRCGSCGEMLDAGSGFAGERPSPGDFSVCAYCGAPGLFLEDLSVRVLTPVELEALPVEVRQTLSEGRDLLRSAALNSRKQWRRGDA